MANLVLSLSSGERLSVTHIRLVNAEVVDGISKRMQELRDIAGKQPGMVVATGDSTFVAGVMATASVVAWLSNKAQAAETRRLTDELAQLIERARTGGMFIPVSKVDGIEIPIPGCWQVEMAKRLRTETGTVDKTVRLCHSGDAFITAQLEDGREMNIFWDKVETVEFVADS